MAEAPTVQPPAAREWLADVGEVPIAHLHPAPWNRPVEGPELEELTQSIRTLGILQPLLVRNVSADYPPGEYVLEIISGHRRLEAARRCGLEAVPVLSAGFVDDDAAREMGLVENTQRLSLKPLEEAHALSDLVMRTGLSFETVAQRIGQAPRYVYDRLKLLKLGKSGRALLTEGRIDVRHAIVLARLEEKAQERAIAEGLFEAERLLWDPSEKVGRLHGSAAKARTPRELQGWIDEHIRAEPARVDPVLFPETATSLKVAAEGGGKVVYITHEYMLRPEARDAKVRTYTRRAWSRADGKEKSKACEHSVLGFIVAGPGRGETLQVCVRKDRCKVHWPEEVKQREARARQAKRTAAKPGGKSAAAAAPARKEDAELRIRLEAFEEQLWDRALAAARQIGIDATPERCLRILAKFQHPYELAKSAFGAKKPVPVHSTQGRKKLAAWIAGAPLPELQAALIEAVVADDPDDELLRDALSIDIQAMRKRGEAEIRALHERERAAAAEKKTKATPAKAAARPRGKRK